MAIDYNFLPSVIVGLKSGLARPCFGSTIALRRTILEQIGGFETFADHLADDNAIGESVRALGLRVTVAPMLVTHSCVERSFGELLRHELRWSRTIRAIAGPSFAGMLITHPLPLALLGAWVFGLSASRDILILAALASRLLLRHQVDRSVSTDASPPAGGWCRCGICSLLRFFARHSSSTGFHGVAGDFWSMPMV
jgi:ceramide glucosyltransferase